MSRPDFERCTVEATRLLYQQDVSNRILSIRNLTYDRNITFDSIQNYCQITKQPLTNFLSEEKQMLKDGCTIYIPKCDLYMVLYNDEIGYFEHLNWTLAHEVGHIYLGHTKDDDLEEVEAHYFAAQLLMPDYTLYMTIKKHGEVSSEDITEIFGVSPEAAQKRLCTMKKRTKFCASILAKQIWNIQQEKIDLYFECKRNGSDYRNMLSLWVKTNVSHGREQRTNRYAHCL